MSPMISSHTMNIPYPFFNPRRVCHVVSP